MGGRQIPIYIRVLHQMIQEQVKSPENKDLPLGVTKLNVSDIKHVHIPVFRGN